MIGNSRWDWVLTWERSGLSKKREEELEGSGLSNIDEEPEDIA